MNKQEEQLGVLYIRNPAAELICYPKRRSHKPLRDWKKSQKKIRREKRQRGYRK